jgi:hypothetical protein
MNMLVLLGHRHSLELRCLWRVQESEAQIEAFEDT